MSKEDTNVAELLQQLEELKRKKAQKLLKLQKLGRRSGKLSLSGSRLENNSETPSNQHLQENNAIVEQTARKKCPKCDSKLKKDQNCSFCNSTRSAADKTKVSKFTLPLQPCNSENHSKTQQISEQATLKLLRSSEGSELTPDSNVAVRENNINTLSVSQISNTSKKSLSLQTSKNYTCKDSFEEEEILSSIDKRQSYALETISKSSDSWKLPTHTSPVHETSDIKSMDFEKDLTFREKEASYDEKNNGLVINTCYESNMRQSFGDSSSKQRKRSSSISEKEDAYECEAKKMRISDDFKLVAEEKNMLVESSIFEDHCNGNVTNQKKDPSEENLINASPKKIFFKSSETKSGDISSNISGLLSGSFSVDENLNTERPLNPVADCTNAKPAETLVRALNKDSFSSSEKNCSISPSLRLSSPFSDELTFPVAVESQPDVTKKQFPAAESVDDDASCDVFGSKVEDYGAKRHVESNVASNDFENINVMSDRLEEKPPETSEGEGNVCRVPDATLDLDALEFTEDLVAEVPEDMEENLSPTLLGSPANINERDGEFEKSVVKSQSEENDNHNSHDQLQNELDGDAQTTDLELDSMSLVAAETEDDTIPETTFVCGQNDSFLFKVPDVPKDLGDAINTELGVADSEIFTIPETEMLNPIEESINLHSNRTCVESGSKCDPHPQNLNSTVRIGPEDAKDPSEPGVTHAAKFSDPFEDNDFLDDSFSESLARIEQCDDFQDTLMVEDTLELGNYKNIPFLNDEYSTEKSHEIVEIEDDISSNIKFAYCVHSEVQEPVSGVKIALFNGCYYTFVKFTKCILVCRLEGKQWNKIFFHEVEEAFELNETCFTKNDTFLVLVMLLKSDQGNCLQFVLFEKDTKVIKLMEQTHWLQNSYSGDTVLLCGLDSLKFSTALGGDFFDVFVHTFSCLDSGPRLLSASLGNSVEGLHSLCPVEGLPNAMIGLSSSMLYVWHLLETRLVTSVYIQPEDVLPIEKCFWAIIENGLMYFLTLCGDLNSSYACQLFVANLATGFCQLASPYNVIPAVEPKLLKKRNLSAAYSEPFLVVSSSDGSFLWSIDDEYCSASLDNDINASAIAITGIKENHYLIAIGTNEGTVNFYNFRCL